FPGETADVQPQAIPLKKVEEAAPRLAPDSAELSRAEPSAVELATPQPINAPQVEAAVELNSPAPSETAESAQPTAPPQAALPAPERSDVQVPIDVSTAVAPLQKANERSIGPQSTTLPGPVTMRTLDAPQVRAPQIADLPRAQSGEAEVREEPQPLVAV